MAKLKKQNMDLLPNGGNFKLNLISRRTGKPVTFNMVDLDRINNCSVSRIINHNGVELGKDWVRKPKSGDEEHKETKKTELIETEPSLEYMSVENVKLKANAQCIQNPNLDVVTLDEEVEDDRLGHGLEDIVSESFQARDEQDMLNAMDLDLDMEPYISDDLPQGSPKMWDQPNPSGLHHALAYLSSLPPDSWSDVERTEWRGKNQRRGVEDEIFGGEVRMPSWGVLHPEESLTRPASLEEVDPDLHKSLASLEALADNLEDSQSRTGGWSCDCEVRNSR